MVHGSINARLEEQEIVDTELEEENEATDTGLEKEEAAKMVDSNLLGNLDSLQSELEGNCA